MIEHRSESLEPLMDSAEVERVSWLIADVVDKPGDFNLEWISNQKWAVAPVEGAMHFNDKDAELLSRAMQETGSETCFAVATEPLENFPTHYRVSTTSEGLLAFSHKCGSFYFVLIPATKDFAVVCTADDYYVVAGKRDFVARAVGSSIEDARYQFLAFASSTEWPDSVRRDLLSVAHKYEDCDGL